MKNPGMFVETKSGKKGRTFHKNLLVNGKEIVYLATKFKPGSGIDVDTEFSDQGTLCDPDSLLTLGYFD